MKVAYMLGALDRGGTETLVLDTLRQGKSNGVPCMLVHRKSGALLTLFQQTGIKTAYQPVKHLLDMWYLIRLRKLFQTEHIQIVHAQLPLDAFLAYWACLGTGIKITLTFHGYDFGYRLFARWMVRFVISRTDLNLYVSKYLRTHYVNAYSLSARSHLNKVVYNGIDFSKFDKLSTHDVRDELSIPLDGLLLGSVGNFVRGRDQLTICRLLKRLHEKQINVYFLFVGARSEAAPTYYDDCVSYCRDNGFIDRVHFLGSRTDVSFILPQLDGFIYASDHDTFGIAVVEALAVGLPVFVNDWSVMQEITDQGQRAVLYKTKDVNDLLDKVLQFIQDRSSYKQQAVANAFWARKAYSIQRHIQKLQVQYQLLVKSND